MGHHFSALQLDSFVQSKSFYDIHVALIVLYAGP